MTFLPMQDNSEFQVTIKAPVGINLESMKKVVEPIDNMLKEDKDILMTEKNLNAALTKVRLAEKLL